MRALRSFVFTFLNQKIFQKLYLIKIFYFTNIFFFSKVIPKSNFFLQKLYWFTDSLKTYFCEFNITYVHCI